MNGKHILHAAYAAATLSLCTCDMGMQPFSNIEADVKTRPLAVVLYPCDASPGDTVSVTTYIYTPEPSISINWSAEIDYQETSSGIPDSRARPMSLETPDSAARETYTYPDQYGLVTHRMQFIIPADALLRSTLPPPEIDISHFTEIDQWWLGLVDPPARISAAVFDELLANAVRSQNSAAHNSLSVPTQLTIDNYSTYIRLTAAVQCEIDLEITRTLPVRYSHTIRTINYNTLPYINELSLFESENGLLSGLTGNFSGTHFDLRPYSNLYWGCDTVTIDTGKYYYFDSITSGDEYRYESLKDGTVLTSTEFIWPTWCITSLDGLGAPEDMTPSISINQLTPPTDTGRHLFRIYHMVRDYRAEYGPRNGIGTNFISTFVYFRYTQAYQNKYH